MMSSRNVIIDKIYPLKGGGRFELDPMLDDINQFAIDMAEKRGHQNSYESLEDGLNKFRSTIEANTRLQEALHGNERLTGIHKSLAQAGVKRLNQAEQDTGHDLTIDFGLESGTEQNPDRRQELERLLANPIYKQQMAMWKNAASPHNKSLIPKDFDKNELELSEIISNEKETGRGRGGRTSR